MKPIFNILIRTSCRPKSFSRCLQSIKEQGFTDVFVIVSADNPETVEYVREHNIEPVIIKKQPGANAPYNLYLNELVDQVQEGWILILDDDDTLKPFALKELADSMFLEDSENVILTRMEWPEGRIIPEDEYFGQYPVRKHIGMPCFMVHYLKKFLLRFDGEKAADYRAAKRIFQNVPAHNLKLLNKPIVLVGNTGNNGKPIDV